MKYITTEDIAKNEIAHLAEHLVNRIRYPNTYANPKDWKDVYESILAEMQAYFNAIVSDEEYERIIEEAMNKKSERA